MPAGLSNASRGVVRGARVEKRWSRSEVRGSGSGGRTNRDHIAFTPKRSCGVSSTLDSRPSTLDPRHSGRLVAPDLVRSSQVNNLQARMTSPAYRRPHEGD